MNTTLLTIPMTINERNAVNALAHQRKISASALIRQWALSECDAAGITVAPRQRRKYERRTKEVQL